HVNPRKANQDAPRSSLPNRAATLTAVGAAKVRSPAITPTTRASSRDAITMNSPVRRDCTLMSRLLQPNGCGNLDNTLLSLFREPPIGQENLAGYDRASCFRGCVVC